MKVSERCLEKRMQAFEAACRHRGVKLTHQRLEIYRALAQTGEHPDVETLYQRLREALPSISRDTVYRNLNMLADEGLISVVGRSRDRLRFDANMEHHHHFVCIRCGLIRDFDATALQPLAPPEEAAAFGTAESVHLEVKGVCKECHSRLKKEPGGKVNSSC